MEVEVSAADMNEWFSAQDTTLHPSVTINEISAYGGESIDIVLHHDRLILRSTEPFTLSRSRQRLCINYTFGYTLCRAFGQNDGWRALNGLTVLLSCNNRFMDLEYMRSVDPTLASPDGFPDWERSFDHLMGRRLASVKRLQLLLPNETAHSELEAQNNALKERVRPYFVLGDADAFHRLCKAARDLDTPESERRHEWVLRGDGIHALRFFNGAGLRFENRSLHTVQVRGLGDESRTQRDRLSVPYTPPMQCRHDYHSHERCECKRDEPKPLFHNRSVLSRDKPVVRRIDLFNNPVLLNALWGRLDGQ